MANRSIFPCDRLRLSLCRDRLDPALRAVSRSPRVCDPSRAVCVSFFRWPRQRLRPAIALAVAGIVAAAVLHLVAAPSLFRWLMPLPDTLKIAASLVLIAPLAFFMGLPFPLALVRVAAARPGLVPWAWGINGCASVLSAILAILLAMSLGFSAVLLIAIGLYLVAAATLR